MLIDFFCHQSFIIYVIPGRPGIPGMRTAIPVFPGIKYTSGNGNTRRASRHRLALQKVGKEMVRKVSLESVTWSTIAHQFQKSPTVDNYAQPVDIILQCRVTGLACSGTCGPFRSPVVLRGTLYQIVSVIQHYTHLYSPEAAA